MDLDIDIEELHEQVSQALVKQHSLWETIEEIVLATNADFAEVAEWISEVAPTHRGTVDEDTKVVVARFLVHFHLDKQELDNPHTL